MVYDLKFFIPAIVAYFNDKIRQYRELEKSGKFADVEWDTKANNLQNLVDELNWLYGDAASNGVRFDYLYWESNANIVYGDMSINEIAEAFKDGYWSCLLEDGQQRILGEYYLSEASQEILNSFRKNGRLDKIQS